MSMKRKKRLRRIIPVYMLRILFGVLLVGMAVLMIFGCLYLRDLFREKEAANVENGISRLTFLEDEVKKEQGEENEAVNQNGESGLCVVLDAGHGGNDGGTFYKEVLEKDVNLSVTLFLQEILEEQGIEVVLTRSADEYLSLEERAFLANQTQADLFVSIHCNYYEDSASVSGLECYYYPKSEDGRKCAQTVSEALKDNDDITVREEKAEDFYVLKNTDMTAILVELGYLSNNMERKNLSSEEYQQILAQGLAEGILLSLDELGEGEELE